MAPDSISEHGNFKNFLEEHTPEHFGRAYRSMLKKLATALYIIFAQCQRLQAFRFSLLLYTKQLYSTLWLLLIDIAIHACVSAPRAKAACQHTTLLVYLAHHSRWGVCCLFSVPGTPPFLQCMVAAKEQEIATLRKELGVKDQQLSSQETALSSLRQRCCSLRSKLDTSQRRILSLEVRRCCQW